MGESETDESVGVAEQTTAANCQGNPDRASHTWQAEPTGDDPNRHTCIRCGDTLIEQ
jgi:hypothetical protein